MEEKKNKVNWKQREKSHWTTYVSFDRMQLQSAHKLNLDPIIRFSWQKAIHRAIWTRNGCERYILLSNDEERLFKKKIWKNEMTYMNIVRTFCSPCSCSWITFRVTKSTFSIVHIQTIFNYIQKINAFVVTLHNMPINTLHFSVQKNKNKKQR